MEKTAKLAREWVILPVVLGLACASAPGGRPATAASPGDASNSRSRTLPIPVEMRQHVRNSEIVGRHIYILDKVSAIATDVMMDCSSVC